MTTIAFALTLLNTEPSSFSARKDLEDKMVRSRAATVLKESAILIWLISKIAALECNKA
jgi:hypothetical protein